MSTKLKQASIECNQLTGGTWCPYKCRDPHGVDKCCYQCPMGYARDNNKLSGDPPKSCDDVGPEPCDWDSTGPWPDCDSGPCIIWNKGDSTCQKAAKSDPSSYCDGDSDCSIWENIKSSNGWCRTCEKDYVPNPGYSMSDDVACTLLGNGGCPSPDECEKGETTCEKSENDKYICDMEDDSDAMKVDSKGAYCGCCPTGLSVADSFTDGHIRTKQDLKDIGLPDLRFGSTVNVNFNEATACSVTGDTCSYFSQYDGYCWACDEGYHYAGAAIPWDSGSACTLNKCPDDTIPHTEHDVPQYGDCYCWRCPDGKVKNAGQDWASSKACCDTFLGISGCESAIAVVACSKPGFKVVPTSVPAAIYKPTSIPAIQGPPDRVNAIEKGTPDLCCRILSADLDSTGCKFSPCENPDEECNITPSQECINCQDYALNDNNCNTYMHGYCSTNIGNVPIPGNGIGNNKNVWDKLDSANFPDGWTGNENYAFIENDNCKNWISGSPDASKATVRNYCIQKDENGNYPAIMRPLCVDYCKENPSDCKDALTDFCGRDGILKNIDENKRIDDLDYIDGQNSGRSVNGAPNICGCYLPQDIYDNFYKDLDETAYITSSGKEAAKHIANFNNYSCSFNACRNSLIHPDSNFPKACPDTSICWNELNIDAKGSIIGKVNIEPGCTGDCDKTVCVNPKYYKCSEDKNGLSCQSQPLGATPTNYGDPTCGGECAPSTAKYLCKGDIIKKTCELQSSGIGMDLDVCNYDCAQENNKNKKIVNIWIIIGSSILVLIISSVIYLVIRRRRLNKGK